MIESVTIEGRKASMAYLSDLYVPCSKASAQFVQILYEDGGSDLIVVTPPEIEIQVGGTSSKALFSKIFKANNQCHNPAGTPQGGQFFSGEKKSSNFKDHQIRASLSNFLFSSKGDLIDSMPEEDRLDYISGAINPEGPYSSDLELSSYSGIEKAMRAQFRSVEGNYSSLSDWIARAPIESFGEFSERLRPSHRNDFAKELVLSLSAEGKAKAWDIIAKELSGKFPGKGELVLSDKVSADYKPKLSKEDKDTFRALLNVASALGNDYKSGGPLMDGSLMDRIADQLSPREALVAGVGMYHKDYDLHQVAFWRDWTANHSSQAREASLKALSGFGPNEGKDLWGGKFPELSASKNLLDNLSRTYRETQDFLAGEGDIELYRGVASSSGDYVPGALEPWTPKESIAKSFSEMMAKNTGESARVVKTKVPKSAILATHKSLKKIFPPDDFLFEEEEHVIIGGGITDIEEIV